MFKEITNKGLDFLFRKFENELDALYSELEELARNRKYNFLEAKAILTADSYLNFVIENMTGIALNGSYPQNYQDWALDIIDRAKFVRAFIYDNFADVFENYPNLLREFASQ